MKAKRSADSVSDVIIDIKKVGKLEDLEHAEIFMVLRDHGDYSIDPYVFPSFESFWLNAHQGSEVFVSESPGGTVGNLWLAVYG